jgi:predicted TIM-barrel fold metal-dependent hydrolase
LAAAAAARAAEVDFAVPDGACDCHHHIYDPRFPYLPDAALKPPFATGADYAKLRKGLGLSRDLAVQPSTYGTDNRCLLDYLSQRGAAARGVCVVNAAVGDAELNRLNRAGVRGVRIQFGVGRPPVGEDEIAPLARRIAPLGWHLQFNLLPDQLVRLEKEIAALPVPVIIDHLGRATDTVSPHYKSVRRLLDSGHAWVKLSGAYLFGSKGPPDYADASSAARAYLAAAPERCVWGSDWPHPDASSGRVAMPDDTVLLKLLGAWAPDPAIRHRILVENPERFYGFDPARRPKA